MTDYINKELWYTDKYYNNKFHHKNVTLKRCLEYSNRNSDFINNNKNGLSDINKDSEEFRCPLNSNYECFIKVPDNTDFQNLTESPNSTLPSSISLSEPQRLYIHKGIEEKDRQKSIVKDLI